MDRTIVKFRKRRYDRLTKRGIRADADWEENKHPRDKDGKFKSGGGSSESKKTENAKEKAPVPAKQVKAAKTIKASIKKFSENLRNAVKTVPPDTAWRVTAGDEKYFTENHPNADYRTTAKGSTFAVDDGDIIGVCRAHDDEYHGRDLVRAAVEAGGKKLDSYSGNHDFYVKCGFEPISWCKFEEQYAPEGWDKERDKKEPVIFYKYVGEGNVKNKRLSEFKEKVKVSKDYMTAMEIRDKEL